MKHIFLSLISIFSFQFSAFSQDEVFDFGKCRIVIEKSKSFSKISFPNSNERISISPSGRFYLHYYTSQDSSLPFIDKNNNLITDYIDTALVEIDDIFKTEVTDLGIDPSYFNQIHIYFNPLGTNYGVTTNGKLKDDGDDGIFGQNPFRSYTYIEINSEINSFPTKGMNMIRVTMAHEFHHVIQFTKGFWDYDFISYYEMSATFYEDVVYNSINDYYYYLQSGIFNSATSPSLFQSPSNTNFIYGSALYFIYVRDKYGINSAVQYEKRILQLLTNMSPLKAMSVAFQEEFNLLVDEFYNEYATATLFTKTKSIESLYFTEASKYPEYKVLAKLDNSIPLVSGDNITIKHVLNKSGFSILWLKLNSREYPLIFSNADFEYFYNTTNQNQQDTIQFNISTSSLNSNVIFDNLYITAYGKNLSYGNIKIKLLDPANNSLVNIPISGNVIIKPVSLGSIFPNPVRLNRDKKVFIRLNLGIPVTTIDFKIFNINGELFVDQKQFHNNNITNVFEIDLSNTLKPISSGVYFYTFNAQSRTNESNSSEQGSGKFAVIK